MTEDSGRLSTCTSFHLFLTQTYTFIASTSTPARSFLSTKVGTLPWYALGVFRSTLPLEIRHMATIKTDFGAGTLNSDAGPSIATALRDIADDFASVSLAAPAALTATAAAALTSAAPAALTSSQLATADANAQTGSYVQADVTSIRTLANAQKVSYNALQVDFVDLRTKYTAVQVDFVDLRTKYTALLADITALRVQLAAQATAGAAKKTVKG